jgi:hypothetical protein
VSFIACVIDSTVKTRSPTQTKKMSYFSKISQKMLYLNYFLQFPKNRRICFFKWKKIPLSWQAFFGPCTSESHCAELAYFNLFTYILLKDLLYGERFLPYDEKNLSLYCYLSMTRTGLWMKQWTLYSQ